MTIHRLTVLLLTLLVAQSLQANDIKNSCNPVNDQNLIINGSFEDIELTDAEFGVRFARTDNIPGWTISGVPKAAVIASYAHSGEKFLQLASSKGYKIAQTVKTQPGKHYLLTFWSAFHREYYADFDLYLSNHAVGSCGTADHHVITAQASWHQSAFILCPETHHMTIAFSQLERDTGNGFGVKLDTISLVPCTMGRPTAEALKFIHQTWVHSYEEDDDESTLVWRKAGSRAFPPTRFRRTLSLYQGDQCQFLSLEPNDDHRRRNCQWSFDPAANQLIIREPTGQLAGNYQLNSLTQDLLMFSK